MSLWERTYNVNNMNQICPLPINHDRIKYNLKKTKNYGFLYMK